MYLYRQDLISMMPCRVPIVMMILSPLVLCQAFVPHGPSPVRTESLAIPTVTVFTLYAKRSKGRREDDLNNWYDDDDNNSPPTGKFWEEIERQRLFNQLGGDPNAATAAATAASEMSMMDMNGIGATTATTAMRTTTEPMSARKPPTMEQLKSAEATLSEYTLFQVNNNWLDENLQAYFSQLDSLDKEPPMTLEEETRRLEEQLEALPDGIGLNRAWLDVDSEEPWEHWGEDDTVVDLDRAKTLEVPKPSPGTSLQQDYSIQPLCTWDDNSLTL